MQYLQTPWFNFECSPQQRVFTAQWFVVSYQRFGRHSDQEIVNGIRSNGIDPSALKEEDLAICSPTVLGFSLNEKAWGRLEHDSS